MERLYSSHTDIPKRILEAEKIFQFTRQLYRLTFEKVTSAMNYTNRTNTTLGPQGPFTYFSLVIIVFLTPLLLFNILLILAIALEKSIVGILRVVLINIITAGLVVNVGLILGAITNVIISGCSCPELRPSDLPCQLSVWLIVSGGAARLMYMAIFAISINILVRYGARKMKIWVAIVAVIGVWLAVLLPNAVVFSPDIIRITIYDDNLCAVHRTGYKTFIYAFGYTTVYGLLGFAVSVFSPIATIWFIRHNTISGDITLVKAMLKFTVFLVLGNVINFVGQTIPLLLAKSAPARKDRNSLEIASGYVVVILILLSLVPTPVLILIYFRPVRQRIKRILCGACTKKVDLSEKSTTSKTATGSEGKAQSANEDM